MSKISVQGEGVTIISKNREDYISLTDIAKHRNKDAPADIVKNWMRSKNTIELLGLWEKLNNQDFKLVEFDQFRNDAGAEIQINNFRTSFMKLLKTTVLTCMIILTSYSIQAQTNIDRLEKSFDKEKAIKYFQKQRIVKVDKGSNWGWSDKGCTYWPIPKYILANQIELINSQDEFIENLTVANKPNHAFILHEGKYHGNISLDFFLSGINANKRFDGDDYGEKEFNFLKGLNAKFIFTVENVPGFFFIQKDSIKVADIVEFKVFSFDNFLLEELYTYFDILETIAVNGTNAYVVKDNKISILTKMEKWESGFFGIKFYKTYVSYTRDPLFRPYIKFRKRHAKYYIPQK